MNFVNIYYNSESDIQYGGQKQKILGEGSYGCVVKPGIDNNGNINKLKNSVTKISEMNFYSKNEYNISESIKKKLANYYNNRFTVILKKNIVEFNVLQDNSKFDINKCENLMEHMDIDSYDYLFDNKYLKQKFFMFYIPYIKGDNLKKNILQNNNNNNNKFIEKYVYYFDYLLYSINLLQKINIVHNDLYDRNIIVKRLDSGNNDVPIIIDYGLTYNSKKMYKYSADGRIDLKYLKKFYFDYRPSSYYHCIDKMFIVFLINNKINNFFVNNLDSDNDLKSKHIDSFIHDYIFSIQQSEKLNFFLQERELNFIKKSMEKYLYSFTNKAKYPDYKSIVNRAFKKYIYLYGYI